MRQVLRLESPCKGVFRFEFLAKNFKFDDQFLAQLFGHQDQVFVPCISSNELGQRNCPKIHELKNSIFDFFTMIFKSFSMCFCSQSYPIALVLSLFSQARNLGDKTCTKRLRNLGQHFSCIYFNLNELLLIKIQINK